MWMTCVVYVNLFTSNILFSTSDGLGRNFRSQGGGAHLEGSLQALFALASLCYPADHSAGMTLVPPPPSLQVKDVALFVRRLLFVEILDAEFIS